MDNDSPDNQDQTIKDDDDPVSRMKQLESLLHEGLIDKKEYSQKRQEILDGL